MRKLTMLNLYCDVYMVDTITSDTWQNDLEELISHTKLTDNECKVLQLRWGEGKTLQAVGEIFGVTRSRINQYEGKIIRKLRDSVERLKELKSFSSTSPISVLDLPVHTYNCLWRGGVATISELCNHNASELFKLRNFGKTDLLNVNNALNVLGLKLKPEDNMELTLEHLYRLVYDCKVEDAVPVNFESVLQNVISRSDLSNQELTVLRLHWSEGLALNYIAQKMQIDLNFINKFEQSGIAKLKAIVYNDLNYITMQSSIEMLNLSCRVYTSLKCGGITTIGELCSYTKRDLLQLRNFGKVSLEEVQKALKAHGFRLKVNTIAG